MGKTRFNRRAKDMNQAGRDEGHKGRRNMDLSIKPKNDTRELNLTKVLYVVKERDGVCVSNSW